MCVKIGSLESRITKIDFLHFLFFFFVLHCFFFRDSSLFLKSIWSPSINLDRFQRYKAWRLLFIAFYVGVPIIVGGTVYPTYSVVDTPNSYYWYINYSSLRCIENKFYIRSALRRTKQHSYV